MSDYDSCWQRAKLVAIGRMVRWFLAAIAIWTCAIVIGTGRPAGVLALLGAAALVAAVFWLIMALVAADYVEYDAGRRDARPWWTESEHAK